MLHQTDAVDTDPAGHGDGSRDPDQPGSDLSSALAISTHPAAAGHSGEARTSPSEAQASAPRVGFWECVKETWKLLRSKESTKARLEAEALKE
ncbi:hypothetical protein [Streptomyces sp. NPDC054865]